MKKFSSITGQKVGQEPKVEVKQITEEDVFKSKVMSLMDDFLTIRTYGPTNRYTHNSTFKIKGKEIFIEALIALLNDENSKSNIKLLESLKQNIKDWEFLDSKIEENKVNDFYKFKYKYRIGKLFDIYQKDEELLIEVLNNKIKKIKNKEILETYSNYIINSSISYSNKEKIIEMINVKINN
jgi:hypothetical protein